MAVSPNGTTPRTTAIAASCVAIFAVALAVIHWRELTEGTPYRRIASLAFGSPFLAVSVAVLIGEVRGKRWIIAGGGCALVAMSLITFSPALLPMMFPAAFLIMRGFGDPQAWHWSACVVATMDAALAVGAVAVLLFHNDPAAWSANGVHHVTSDIITRTEAVISLGLSGSVIAVAFASPPRGTAR